MFSLSLLQCGKSLYRLGYNVYYVEVKVMNTIPLSVRLDNKGRATIPVHVRELLDVDRGDIIVIHVERKL